MWKSALTLVFLVGATASFSSCTQSSSQAIESGSCQDTVRLIEICVQAGYDFEQVGSAVGSDECSANGASGVVSGRCTILGSGECKVICRRPTDGSGDMSGDMDMDVTPDLGEPHDMSDVGNASDYSQSDAGGAYAGYEAHELFDELTYELADVSCFKGKECGLLGPEFGPSETAQDVCLETTDFDTLLIEGLLADGSVLYTGSVQDFVQCKADLSSLLLRTSCEDFSVALGGVALPISVAEMRHVDLLWSATCRFMFVGQRLAGDVCQAGADFIETDVVCQPDLYCDGTISTCEALPRRE